MTPWLKVRCDLHEDLGVVAASIKLAQSENEIVGALVKFWSWANRQTEKGDAPGVTKTWLDHYVGVAGFADALCEVGWLEAGTKGITVPKFDRHNGESAKQRAQTALRNRTYKQALGSATPEGSGCGDAKVTQKVTPPSSPERHQEEELEEEGRPKKKRERASAFVPPSLDEVAAYCRERNNAVDPARFIAHYQSNGWRVGKNPMRDWRAAVRTWEGNGIDDGRRPGANGHAVHLFSGALAFRDAGKEGGAHVQG